MDAQPPRNTLATLLSYVPVLGHAGRFIAEERFVAFSVLLLTVLAAIAAAIYHFGGGVLILVGNAATLIAGLVILAMTRDG